MSLLTLKTLIAVHDLLRNNSFIRVICCYFSPYVIKHSENLLLLSGDGDYWSMIYSRGTFPLILIRETCFRTQRLRACAIRATGLFFFSITVSRAAVTKDRNCQCFCLLCISLSLEPCWWGSRNFKTNNEFGEILIRQKCWFRYSNDSMFRLYYKYAKRETLSPLLDVNSKKAFFHGIFFLHR